MSHNCCFSLEIVNEKDSLSRARMNTLSIYTELN